MEKLNLQRNKEDFYILEVNDNGDTIEFDLTDIGLADKIMKASERILEVDKEYQENIEKFTNEFKDDKVELTRNIIKLEMSKSAEMRKIFDSFLGEGACQKIFGDKNNYGQFVNLMDALEPHFNKMELKIDKAKRRLVEKYLPNNNNVI